MSTRKRIDMRVLNKNLSFNRTFKKEMRQRVEKTFDRSKQLLLQDFKSHPVTREIAGGTGANNVSGTLGGYGNLFTFIGFPFGSTPIETVEALLRSIKLGKVKNTTTSRRKVTVNVDIEMPTKQQFASATPLPFENGRSWLYGIETGISGFGSYMYKKWKTSRSGEGIQTKKKIRSGGFRNTSYFSSMLLAFTKRIR
tara:strand:- start:735 stop:1325 length:591 start_codon:yes stop_codon:yes gene_type:complete